jgi:hypothetical protein
MKKEILHPSLGPHSWVSSHPIAGLIPACFVSMGITLKGYPYSCRALCGTSWGLPCISVQCLLCPVLSPLLFYRCSCWYTPQPVSFLHTNCPSSSFSRKLHLRASLNINHNIKCLWQVKHLLKKTVDMKLIVQQGKASRESLKNPSRQ